jgi:hypothetical protein
MNRAEFDARYRLGDRIAEGAVLSYRAHDLAAGREVRIHLLAGTTPDEAAQLRDLLQELQPGDRGLILAETDVEGIGVVVSEALPDFTTLPSWLESRVSGVPPAGEGNTPGEFTRLFGAMPPESQPGGASPLSAPLPRPESGSGNEPVPPLGPSNPARPPRPVIRLGGAPPPRTPEPALPFHLPDPPRHTDERPMFSSQLGSGATGSLWAAGPLGDPSAAPPRSSPPLRGPADIAELIATAGAGVGRQDQSREASDSPRSATPEEPPKRSYVPLVVMLTTLLLSAVGLVVYFALKSH